MKNTVTVRKCKSHLYAIRVFAVLLAIFPIIIIFSLQDALVALPGCIPFLMIAPMALYYETWQIRFSKNGIEKKVFFRVMKHYSYAQLREVVKGYYMSEKNYCIRMHFADGKKLQFRLDDENAAKAEKQLQKHCSFKTVS